ncbi:stressosome-associated protein Prli42 [Marinithermofilum abyssi]|nr:stressosome-associated protein Prli42 [Marinithermofilum abyssi]
MQPTWVRAIVYLIIFTLVITTLILGSGPLFM